MFGLRGTRLVWLLCFILFYFLCLGFSSGLRYSCYIGGLLFLLLLIWFDLRIVGFDGVYCIRLPDSFVVMFLEVGLVLIVCITLFY